MTSATAPPRSWNARHDRQREVFDRTGRHLRHRGGDVRGPVPGQHRTGRTGTLGAAEKRSHVVWVGDAVQNEKKRHDPAVRSAQLIEVGFLQGRGQRQDSLHGVGSGSPLQPPPRHEEHPDPAAGREALDLVHDRRWLQTVSDPHLPNLTSASQQLANGLPPLHLLTAKPVPLFSPAARGDAAGATISGTTAAATPCTPDRTAGAPDATAAPAGAAPPSW
jgi:hypothetical protein